MGKSSKFQICSSLVCVAVGVVACLFFTCVLESGLSGFLVTVPVLVLSSVFVRTRNKKKKKEVTFDENPVQEEDQNPISCKVENFLENDQVGEKIEEKMKPLMENVEKNPFSGKVSNFLGNDQVDEKVEEKMQALMENDAQENPFSGKVSNFLGNDQVGERVEVKMEALMENDAQGSLFSARVSNFPGNNQVGEKVEEKMQALMENVEENEAAGFVKEPHFDFVSETESSTSGDDIDGANFELDWMCYNNINGGHDHNNEEKMMMRRRRRTTSSESVSVSSSEDEDGLIEISIPSEDEVDHDQEESINNTKQLQADSDFNEAINEEENLIEIDISIGSIKCSRFEIEA